jgi:hypothetical protein
MRKKAHSFSEANILIGEWFDHVPGTKRTWLDRWIKNHLVLRNDLRFVDIRR